MCEYPGEYITFSSVFRSSVGRKLKKEIYLIMNLDAHLMSLLSRSVQEGQRFQRREEETPLNTTYTQLYTARPTPCRSVKERWPQQDTHTHTFTQLLKLNLGATKTDRLHMNSRSWDPTYIEHTHTHTASLPITALWLKPASTATFTPFLHRSFTLRWFSLLRSLCPPPLPFLLHLTSIF